MRPFRALHILLPVLLAAFAPQAVAGLSLGGTVLDAEQKPVEGADVWVVQGSEVRRTRTEASGRFGFADLSVAHTQLVTRKEGLALGGSTGLLTADETVTVTLGPAAALPLRITNRDFLPVAGARVRSLVVSDQFAVPVEQLVENGFPALRSGDDGGLSIPGLPPGGFVKLVAAHLKYADSSVAYLPVQDKRRDIQLYEGAAVRGRVTDPGGGGVPRAWVSVFQTGVGGQREEAGAWTDPEGFYTLRVADGGYLVTARHPDHASPLPADLEVNGEEVTHDLALPETRVLSGRVLLPGRKPCPGTRAGFRVGGVFCEEALTDDQGVFRLRVGVPEGDLLIAPPPGYRTRALPRIPVNLGDKQELRLEDIQLTELPRITGTVRAPQDTGDGGRIVITSLDLPQPLRLLAGPDGAFDIRLDYQPEQNEVTFRAEHALRFLRKDFKVSLDDAATLEVVLEPFEPDLKRRPADEARNNLSALVGKEAPEIKCSDWFNTQPVTNESLKGKVTVLVFWGGFDDSPFAVNQLGELRALHDAFQGVDDVLVLGIHDASSTADEVKEFLGRYDVRFAVGKDADPFFTFVNYGINAIPQVVLLDKKGVVRYYQPESRLLELVKTLRRE